MCDNPANEWGYATSLFSFVQYMWDNVSLKSLCESSSENKGVLLVRKDVNKMLFRECVSAEMNT